MKELEVVGKELDEAIHVTVVERAECERVELRDRPECMSRNITIRHIPDGTGDALAARAAASGRSLQEYLRGQLIELARRPDPEALMASVRRRKERTGSRLSVESILEHRDADRR